MLTTSPAASCFCRQPVLGRAQAGPASRSAQVNQPGPGRSPKATSCRRRGSRSDRPVERSLASAASGQRVSTICTKSEPLKAIPDDQCRDVGHPQGVLQLEEPVGRVDVDQHRPQAADRELRHNPLRRVHRPDAHVLAPRDSQRQSTPGRLARPAGRARSMTTRSFSAGKNQGVAVRMGRYRLVGAYRRPSGRPPREAVHGWGWALLTSRRGSFCAPVRPRTSYRPHGCVSTHRGGRLSRNARIPSWASLGDTNRCADGGSPAQASWADPGLVDQPLDRRDRLGCRMESCPCPARRPRQGSDPPATWLIKPQ